jgi:hypothetical protein
MITDAPFAGTSRAGVLDSIAGKDLDRAIIHHHRDGDRQLSLWLAQDGVYAGVEIDPPSHIVKHVQHRAPKIFFAWLGHDKTRRWLSQCLTNGAGCYVLVLHDTLLWMV